MIFSVSERQLGLKQKNVLNNSGRDVVFNEFVFLNNTLGNVKDFGGIPNGQRGNICIDDKRTVVTNQTEINQNFLIDDFVYFLQKDDGYGLFIDSQTALNNPAAIPAGIITSNGGVDFVEFQPFNQNYFENYSKQEE